MLAATAAGSAVLAIGVVGGYLLRDVLRIGSNSGGDGMMSGMMGVGSADMNRYMDLFNRHTEIRRTVEQIAGGVRTTTESDSPDLVAQLQAHVSSMYSHLDDDPAITRAIRAHADEVSGFVRDGMPAMMGGMMGG